MHVHRHLSPACDLVSHGDGQDNIGEELQNTRRQERREGQSSYPNDVSTGHVTLPSNEKIGSLNILTGGRHRPCHYDEDIGIQNQSPRYLNYSPLHIRISSSERWPGYLNQTPREMALAGFLFAGYNNYTRCFHCGGGLRNWESGDDPWVEHARWFPQYGFLKQNKGENFIQVVLKKHNMVF
ncbi:BIRC2_3 [Mytilus coruscus]|uniref:BIRC2_3 n=1 Tax=Mytilus coruscus TaxID=42192 RepID=A0A6J8ACG8_MYTCO|nr:BIRC2_3 [Mytilus coruscus]